MSNDYNEPISAAEREDYGDAFIKVAGKAGKEAMAGELHSLKQGMAEVQSAIAREQRDRMKKELDGAVPEWRSINDSPEFLSWLGQQDKLSGQSRLNLLRSAWARNDVQTVKNHFADFQREGGQRPQQRQQRQAQGRQAADGRQIIRGADIRAYYADVARGRYTAEQRAQHEAELQKALAEGRVIE